MVRMSGAGAVATDTASHTTDTPELLQEHHLPELRLPTILREYDKVARQCAEQKAERASILVTSNLPFKEWTEEDGGTKTIGVTFGTSVPVRPKY